jgi:hypothetical protein
MRFILGLVHNPSTAAPRTDFPRFYEQVVAQIARCVDAGVASGEFVAGPTEVRLLVFMGALGESLCGNVIVGRPELTPDLADALVESVTAGWRPATKA